MKKLTHTITSLLSRANESDVIRNIIMLGHKSIYPLITYLFKTDFDTSHFLLCPRQNVFNLRDFIDSLTLEGGTTSLS